MAEETGAEKTEEPTARKLQKAREDGQVARSNELPGAAVMIGAVALMVMMGGVLLPQLIAVFKAGFIFDRTTLLTPSLLPLTFGSHAVSAFVVIIPIFIVTVVLAILSSGATGGYLFSLKSIAPKGSKINPLEGFKRMFGKKALVELAKAVLKFSLVTGVLILMININLGELIQIGRMPLEPAMQKAGELVAHSALYVTLSLVVIAAIDMPWQKHEFNERMKMTKQEVKDEYKDIEGRPEVKAQIRRRQREMSNQRMMQNVKDADVVITNPEHFAVALSYDPTGDGAPIVVAKGADLIAAGIREEAKTHGVYVFQAPPLARALFYTTEVDQTVPEELYVAVAQVIAYVFNLDNVKPGQPGMQKPKPVVPPEMAFDASGKLQ
ncbi:MAG: flagellar biosynthesis protein FlhB [Burkholderiaceae bacterium]|jgi:flagellar biosynthesis protein FlhB|nr:flagellar biosynthesis protein FlhB [Burkholderiaceae bacterium]